LNDSKGSRFTPLAVVAEYEVMQSFASTTREHCDDPRDTLIKAENDCNDASKSCPDDKSGYCSK